MSDSSDDPMITQLRERRMAEMQQQMEQAAHQQAEKEAVQIRDEAMKNSARIHFSSDARQRLAAIEMARPELAKGIRQQVLVQIEQGHLNPPISEEIVKSFARQLENRRTRSTIRRV